MIQIRSTEQLLALRQRDPQLMAFMTEKSKIVAEGFDLSLGPLIVLDQHSLRLGRFDRDILHGNMTICASRWDRFEELCVEFWELRDDMGMGVYIFSNDMGAEIFFRDQTLVDSLMKGKS